MPQTELVVELSSTQLVERMTINKSEVGLLKKLQRFCKVLEFRRRYYPPRFSDNWEYIAVLVPHQEPNIDPMSLEGLVEFMHDGLEKVEWNVEKKRTVRQAKPMDGFISKGPLPYTHKQCSFPGHTGIIARPYYLGCPGTDKRLTVHLFPTLALYHAHRKGGVLHLPKLSSYESGNEFFRDSFFGFIASDLRFLTASKPLDNIYPDGGRVFSFTAPHFGTLTYESKLFGPVCDAHARDTLVSIVQEKSSCARLQSAQEAALFRIEGLGCDDSDLCQLTRTAAIYFNQQGVWHVAFDDIADPESNVFLSRMEEFLKFEAVKPKIVYRKNSKIVASALLRAQSTGRVIRLSHYKTDCRRAHYVPKQMQLLVAIFGSYADTFLRFYSQQRAEDISQIPHFGYGELANRSILDKNIRKDEVVVYPVILPQTGYSYFDAADRTFGITHLTRWRSYPLRARRVINPLEFIS